MSMGSRCVLVAGLSLLVVSCGSPAPPAPKKIEWLTAPSGAVASIVKAEAARAQREGRRVLVYVGATWCEPCRRFHEAVKSGQLDDQFGQLRFIEFDLDRDNERLATAGYTPKMIPLLAVPDAEGLATGHQMEGSIKGGGAVAQMAPRLHALLEN